MKFLIHTLGCKVNHYESCMIREQLIAAGHTPCNEDGNPDIVVVNSCTVTSVADKKSLRAVRHFKRNGARVVALTGCVPQAYPETALATKEADIVAGNKTNVKLVSAIEAFLKSNERTEILEEHLSGDKFIPCSVTSFAERTRANIKIQDGCNRFCSYCAIPAARGRSRSKQLADIEAELSAIAEAGYKEVVFTGINLSSFGRDTGCDLADAVRLACNTDGIERVRLGSLEPDHITDEMIERLLDADGSTNKLCPQFHISLQSGCDSTLKRMNRHYDTAEFEHLCKKLRSTFKNCTLTTDVMTGFPGESESDFETSLGFVEKIGFEKIHVFPYSPRENTRAYTMPDLPEKAVREGRCKKMIAVGDTVRLRYFNSLIGKTVNVLFETTEKDGTISGYTENYTPVKAKAPQTLCGTSVECEIIGTEDDFCIGKLKQE